MDQPKHPKRSERPVYRMAHRMLPHQRISFATRFRHVTPGFGECVTKRGCSWSRMLDVISNLCSLPNKICVNFLITNLQPLSAQQQPAISEFPFSSLLRRNPIWKRGNGHTVYYFISNDLVRAAIRNMRRGTLFDFQIASSKQVRVRVPFTVICHDMYEHESIWGIADNPLCIGPQWICDCS